MKLDFSKIDLDEFSITDCVIAGDNCFFIGPKRGQFPKWTKDNLHLRSGIWNESGEPVSLSYQKFFNWGEHPEIHAPPKDLRECKLIEKIDGSTLICSKYKGELILRTRGTVSAYGMKNGHELDVLKERYKNFFDIMEEDKTYLFEWTTPLNVIVLKYSGDVEMYLTNIVNHKDYSLTSQVQLDNFANLHGLKRPRTFHFNLIEEMLAAVEALKGQEGICVYYKNKHVDQYIRKVKSAWYLALHRMKSELGSYDRVIDLYFTFGEPTYTEFYSYIETQFDFELAESCKSSMSRICEAMKEVRKIQAAMKAKADLLKDLPRKDAALRIVSEYGPTNRSSMVFNYLDGKEMQVNEVKKLLYQVSKM